MTPYSLSGLSGTSIFLLNLFSNYATNLSEALWITSSYGRSRAKELFRIGPLTQELTNGMHYRNGCLQKLLNKNENNTLFLFLYLTHFNPPCLQKPRVAHIPM